MEYNKTNIKTFVSVEESDSKDGKDFVSPYNYYYNSVHVHELDLFSYSGNYKEIKRSRSYFLQKRALDLHHGEDTYIIPDEFYAVSKDGTPDFIEFIDLSPSRLFQFIKENEKGISKVLPDIEREFYLYLTSYLNSVLFFSTKVMYDSKYNIQLNEPVCILKPLLRFFSEYKTKKMNTVLNFSKFIDLYHKEPDNEFFNLPESKELLNILNKPCLFLTFTMGNDRPLKTAVKYKDGWKGFYNNLRYLAKKYGFNMDYFIKGVEFTKENRLHVHFLILGVELDPLRLLEFKSDLEDKLALAGFGFINDVTYITNHKTYLSKTLKGWNKIKNNPKYRNIKKLDAKTFKFKKNNKVHSTTVYLLEANYVPKKEYDYTSSTKVVNYVFKYILKYTPFDKLEKNKHIKRFLKSNVIFWLLGIRRFDMSRKLSKLLKSFSDYFYSQRYLFFNSEKDLDEFLAGGSVGRAEFDRDLLFGGMGSLVDRYPYTAVGLYQSLNLEVTPYLRGVRYRSCRLRGASDDAGALAPVAWSCGMCPRR
jgi:hypothetical protein